MTSEREKLRDEIIGMQAAQADLQKWKILGIGAVFAIGLGYSKVTNGDTAFALFAIPFLTVYADLLTRNYDLRIARIARFLLGGTDDLAEYERSLIKPGSTRVPFGTLETVAIAVSSFLANVAVLLLVLVFDIPASSHIQSPLLWAAAIGCSLSVVVVLPTSLLLGKIV